jgi:hypothetical protein
MKRDEKSPVVQLMILVWNNVNHVTSHSWERLNQAMLQALFLAIGSGWAFEVDDFKEIYESFRGGRWLGHQGLEGPYAKAISVANRSAAMAIEAYLERPPFMMNNVDQPGGGIYMHGGWTRKRDRLAVGSQFDWEGYRVRVTSFSGKDELIACYYKQMKRSESPAKRFRISRKDLPRPEKP